MDNYSPSPEVLEWLRGVDMVLLVGPSGAGKTTLIQQLLQNYDNYHFVMTEMSRTPRPGEVDGVDQHFRTRQYMEKQIAARQYVQVAPSVFGDYYATSVDEYAPGKICLLPCIADEVAAVRKLPFKSLTVVSGLPPSTDELFGRMGGHQFTPEKLRLRLLEAASSLRLAAHGQTDAYVITNGVSAATKTLRHITTGGQGDDPAHARQLAAGLLQQVMVKLA